MPSLQYWHAVEVDVEETVVVLVEEGRGGMSRLTEHLTLMKLPVSLLLLSMVLLEWDHLVNIMVAQRRSWSSGW